jgi:hypothetical protein
VARYPLGQPVTIPVTVQQRNTDGSYSLVDAGTLTLVVKLAGTDGTFTVTGTYPTPVHDGLGLYHFAIPAADLAAPGHYEWVATSTGTGAGAVPGDFDVYDPYPSGAGLYCTTEELKARLNISDTADDAQAVLAAAAASRAVDGYCDRFFSRITATRTYVPRSLYETRTDDLVSVTALATDPAGTAPQGGTFPVSWPAGSFQLLPYNPGRGSEPWPYTRIRAVGGLTFPWVIPLLLMRMDRVQVTGVFGWPAVPEDVRTATLTLAADLFKLKDAPFGVAGFGEFGAVRVQANPGVAQLLGPYRRAPFLAA